MLHQVIVNACEINGKVESLSRKRSCKKGMVLLELKNTISGKKFSG